MIKTLLFENRRDKRADLKHCGKIPEAKEELNRSVREGRIESRHSIKSLEGMGSSSHDLEAELRMHSFTINCETFSNEEKVAAVVPVTSVEVIIIIIIMVIFKCYFSGELIALT